MNPFDSTREGPARAGREINESYHRALTKEDARGRGERPPIKDAASKASEPDLTYVEVPAAAHDQPRKLLLEDVIDSPFQPRKRPLGKKDVAELMGSLAAAGQVTPIVVSPVPDQPGKFHVHSGHRRCAALRLLGKTHVSAVVRKDLDERQARTIALADNIGREDLTAYEQAVALRDFAAAFALSFEQAGGELGIQARTAYRLKSLLGASEELLALFGQYAIPAKPADLLVKLESSNPRRALRLAKQYAEGRVTSTELEAAAKNKDRPTRGAAAGRDFELRRDDKTVAFKARVVRAAMSDEKRQRLRTALAEFLGEVGIEVVRAAPRAPTVGEA